MLRSILHNSTAGFYVFASDSTTPTNGKTGLTIAASLSKTGGTENAVSPTITEIGNGLYWVAPIAAHRDTLGEIAWQFSAAGAVIAPRIEKVVAVNDQAAAFGANTTAPDNATIASIYSVLQLTDADVATLLTRIGSPAGASIAADIAAAKTDTAAVRVVTDRINTGLVADGLVWQFTANMVELAPSAGSSGGLTEEQAETLDSIAVAIAGTAPVQTTGRIANGGRILAYVGDDFTVRSGTALPIPVKDPAGGLYTLLTSIGVDNLQFGASLAGKPAGLITGTIASVTQSGSGSSQLCNITVEITNCGVGLKLSEDYEWQIQSTQTHGDETDTLIRLEGMLSLRKNVVS